MNRRWYWFAIGDEFAGSCFASKDKLKQILTKNPNAKVVESFDKWHEHIFWLKSYGFKTNRPMLYGLGKFDA